MNIREILRKLWEPEVIMRLFGSYMLIFGVFFAIRVSNIYFPGKEYIILLRMLIAPLLFLYSAFSIFQNKKSGWIMIVFLQFFLIGLAIIQMFHISVVPPVYESIGGTGFFFWLLNIFIPVFIIVIANRKNSSYTI